MASQLSGKKIAFLATDGFEQAELLEPRKALDEAGATTVLISPKSGEIKGWNHTEWGQTVNVDKSLADANPNDYDALVLPGGVINPDHLRMDPAAVNFVKQFVATGRDYRRHLPWSLDTARSRRCQRQDGHLVAVAQDRPARMPAPTGSIRKWSRTANSSSAANPIDIPAFNRAIIESVQPEREQQRSAA